MPRELAQLLIDEAVVSADGMERALARQREAGGALDTALLELGLIAEEVLVTCLSRAADLPPAPLSAYDVVDGRARRVFPSKVAERHGLAPFALEGRELSLVATSPVDLGLLDEISFMLSLHLAPHVGPEWRVRSLIQRLYGGPLSPRLARLAEAMNSGVPPAPAPEVEPPAPPPVAVSAFSGGDGSFLGPRMPSVQEVAPSSPPSASVPEPLAEPEPEPQPEPEAPPPPPVPAHPAPRLTPPMITPLPFPPPPPPRPPPSRPRPPAGFGGFTRGEGEPLEPLAAALALALESVDIDWSDGAPPLVAPQPPAPEPAPAEATTDVEGPSAEPVAEPRPAAPVEEAASSEPPPPPATASVAAQPPRPIDRSAPPRWTVAQARAALAEAQTRDEIVVASLRYARDFFEFAGLFAVTRDAVVGHDALYPEGDARELCRTVALYADDVGVFRTTIETQAPYLGRVSPEAPGNQVILDGLARGTPRTVLVYPILLRGRVVCLLYGDNGPAPVSARRLGDLLVVLASVGAAFERVIKTRKAEPAPEPAADEAPRLEPTPAVEVAPESPETWTTKEPAVAEPPPAVEAAPLPEPEPPPAVEAAAPPAPEPAVQVTAPPEPELPPAVEAARLPEPVPPPTVEVAAPPEPEPPAPPPGTVIGEQPLIAGGGALELDDVPSEAPAPPAPPDEAPRPVPPPLPASRTRSVPAAVLPDIAALVGAYLVCPRGSDERPHLLAQLTARAEAAAPILCDQLPGPLEVEPEALARTPASQQGPVMAGVAALGLAAVRPLLALLADPAPGRRRAAAALLGAAGDPSAFGPLADRTVDADPVVAEAARTALAAHRRDPAMKPVAERLRRALLSGLADRAAAAARAIAALRDAESIPLLIQALEGSDAATAAASSAALTAITLQRHGPTPRAWLLWWKENRGRGRAQWLFGALTSEDRELRLAAAAEIREAAPSPVPYSADLPPIQREQAARDWAGWFARAGHTL